MASPDVAEGFMYFWILAIVPQQLVIIDLHHTGIRQFFHLHLGPRWSVPGFRSIRVFLLKLPQKCCEVLHLLLRYRIFDNHVPILDPEIPILFAQYF